MTVCASYEDVLFTAVPKTVRNRRLRAIDTTVDKMIYVQGTNHYSTTCITLRINDYNRPKILVNWGKNGIIVRFKFCVKKMDTRNDHIF